MNVQEAKMKLQSFGLIARVFTGERRVFGGTTITDTEPYLIENNFVISQDGSEWEVSVSCLGKPRERVVLANLDAAVMYVIDYYKDWEKAYKKKG